jgi:hypothetical protein
VSLAHSRRPSSPRGVTDVPPTSLERAFERPPLRTCRGRDTPLRTCRGRALNVPCKGRAMNDLKPAGLKGPVLGPVFYISYSLYMFIYRGSQRASLESPRASLPLKPPVFRVAEASRDSPGLKYIVSRSVSLQGTLPYCSVSLEGTLPDSGANRHLSTLLQSRAHTVH